MDIREHLEVIDAAGNHVGTVDKVQGDQIKLTWKDSPDGQHHYIEKSHVAGVEGNKVQLAQNAPSLP
jgi:hypothetical protein